MLTESFFAIGASLAALANVETALRFPPHVLDPTTRIPLLGPIRRQTLDRAVQRNGAASVAMTWDMVRDDALQAFIVATWGGYTTASKALYASWLDESGHFSPFAVTLERPLQGEHYTLSNGWVQQLRIPGYGWTLQSATKSANYTVTASDRLLYVDTTSGNVTLALPAAATPGAYTLFSAVKTAAGNNLVLDPNGSELIDGASTKTITALNARVDFYSDGTAWHTL